MTRLRRIGRPALLTLAFLAAADLAIVLFQTAGLRVNATASMPLGLYRVEAYHGEPLARGALVTVCLAPGALTFARARNYLKPGPCPGEVEPLLKHVAALGGDRVDVSARGVTVNGRALPDSGRVAHDCAGRPLPHVRDGRYVLAPGTIWLYAPAPRSWDSRYFGAQPAVSIAGLAAPVLTVTPPARACAS